uniref:BD-FAE-like domain-containing protein n=1 Tax=Aplanochytrium stocchinoi TaxID=215587 RepID=A0A7S3PLX8_9STRA
MDQGKKEAALLLGSALTSFYLSHKMSKEVTGMENMLTFFPTAMLWQSLPTVMVSQVYLIRRYFALSDASMVSWISLALHVLATRKFVEQYKTQFEAKHLFEQALKDANIPLHYGSGKIGDMSYYRWLSTLLLPFAPYLTTALAYNSPLSNLQVVNHIYYTKQKHGSQVLDVIFPKDAKSILKNQSINCLLYVHGGGWTVGKRFFHSLHLLMDMAHNGFVVCTMDYRLAPTNNVEDQVFDVKSGICWIKSNLINVLQEQFGGSLKHRDISLCIGGESAGGHLSLMAAMTMNDPKWQPSDQEYSVTDTSLDGCLDLYGVRDFTDSEEHWYKLDGGGFRNYIRHYVFQRCTLEHAEAHENLSPKLLLNRPFVELPPPIFGIHGTHDTLIPLDEAESFYAALKEGRKQWSGQSNSVNDVFVVIPYGPHGLNILANPVSFALSDAAENFLLACTRNRKRNLTVAKL